MMFLKLSIIALFYNQASIFNRILNSVKESNIEDYEIIIIDDGSSYAEYLQLENQCKSYKNVKIIRMNHNTRNQSMCRNLGIKIATGDYITYKIGRASCRERVSSPV